MIFCTSGRDNICSFYPGLFFAVQTVISSQVCWHFISKKIIIMLMMERDRIQILLKSLKSVENNRQVRLVSILSAAIAVSNNDFTEQTMVELKNHGLDRRVIYESVLQSYLFLGFPRMIEAALVFNKVFGDIENHTDIEKISKNEAEKWYRDGIDLCGIVYGKNYERLKEKFLRVSPDLFRWMVLEGYGKVLSRAGMSRMERELAEVAALIVDKRRRQLVSHVMGSLNVGAPIGLIKLVNEDIRPIAGDKAYSMAVDVIEEIELRYEA